MAFPSSVLSLAHAVGSQFLSVFFGGSVAHSTGVNQIIDDLAATETKVGISEASAQDSPLANTVLASLTNGKSKWTTVTNAMIAAAAGIPYSKLSLATSIVNADIATAAAIAVSKLAAGAANSVLTSNGTTNSFSATPRVDALGVGTAAGGAGTITSSAHINSTGGNISTSAGNITSSGTVTAGTGITATTGNIAASAGNVSASGSVTAGTKLFASGQAVMYYSAPVVAATPASGASALLAPGSTQGIVHVLDASTGRSAIFEIESGANAVKLLAGDATVFSDAAPAADNKIHCIYSAGNYFLYNGYGVAHTLYASINGIA